MLRRLPLRAISIDDDQMAIFVISKYVEFSSDLTLIGTYDDPVKGMAGIVRDQPDILFIDMEMPSLNGIEVILSLKRPPKIIVISANPDYKDVSLKSKALAFLTKPLIYKEFEAAVDLARTSIIQEQLI